MAQAARDATLIGDEDEAFKGGSYVIVQKYLHDMKKWDEIPVEQQEKIIGRKKLSNVELDDAAKPSYAQRADRHREGWREQPILRDNMPFGDAGKGEFGTTSSATRARPRASSACWTTCSWATRRATTTVCWTSAAP